MKRFGFSSFLIVLTAALGFAAAGCGDSVPMNITGTVVDMDNQLLPNLAVTFCYETQHNDDSGNITTDAPQCDDLTTQADGTFSTSFNAVYTASTNPSGIKVYLKVGDATYPGVIPPGNPDFKQVIDHYTNESLNYTFKIDASNLPTSSGSSSNGSSATN